MSGYSEHAVNTIVNVAIDFHICHLIILKTSILQNGESNLKGISVRGLLYCSLSVPAIRDFYVQRGDIAVYKFIYLFIYSSFIRISFTFHCKV